MFQKFQNLNVYCLALMLLLMSCGVKETIIPMYNTETASEQQINRNSDNDNGTQVGPNGQTPDNGDRKIYFYEENIISPISKSIEQWMDQFLFQALVIY